MVILRLPQSKLTKGIQSQCTKEIDKQKTKALNTGNISESYSNNSGQSQTGWPGLQESTYCYRHSNHSQYLCIYRTVKVGLDICIILLNVGSVRGHSCLIWDKLLQTIKSWIRSVKRSISQSAFKKGTRSSSEDIKKIQCSEK